jgi:hypothetical protein
MSVAKWAAYGMAFLDSIGQSGPQSRAQGSRSSPINQSPTRNDAVRAIQIAPVAPAPMAPQNDRIHPAAIWCAVLFVVGAVAAAAWLGMRNSGLVGSPATETAADAQTETPTPVDKVDPKQKLVRPQAAGRRATGVKTAGAGTTKRADSTSEASVSDLAPVGQPVTETAGQPIAAAADTAAAIVPLPEDDNVYSSDGGGVVAPRLTSLGFTRRLVGGLQVRTSTIELVVSKSGTVERAKIFSTPAHWEDALLLSRAKMFQFVPAYRDGFPVRYRFLLDVDTSP